MFFSLNGWLHDLSDSYLFSAHMVQHLLLALVVAPLMIMGTPGGMLRPALSLRGVGPVARWLTKPAHCFAIFTVVLAGWHLPPLYNYALAHHPVHIGQHLMFLVGVGADVVAGAQPAPRAAATQLPAADALSVPAEHPDGDRLRVSSPTPTACCIRSTRARRASGASRR